MSPPNDRSSPPVPQNVTLFGDGVFADNEDEIIDVGPNPTSWINVLIKKKKEHLDPGMDTQGEKYVIGIVLPPPRNHQEREAWGRPSPCASRRSMALPHLGFGLLTSRAVRQSVLVV